MVVASKMPAAFCSGVPSMAMRPKGMLPYWPAKARSAFSWLDNVLVVSSSAALAFFCASTWYFSFSRFHVLTATRWCSGEIMPLAFMSSSRSRVLGSIGFRPLN